MCCRLTMRFQHLELANLQTRLFQETGIQRMQITAAAHDDSFGTPVSSIGRVDHSILNARNEGLEGALNTVALAEPPGYLSAYPSRINAELRGAVHAGRQAIRIDEVTAFDDLIGPKQTSLMGLPVTEFLQHGKFVGMVSRVDRSTRFG